MISTATTVEALSVSISSRAFIEDFDLPDELRWQNTVTPEFPQVLAGTVEGQTVPIPVTWEADHAYNPKAPEMGLYVFTVVFDKRYAMAEGVEAPRIVVYIPQSTGRILMRMTGGGTDTSPLEITTAAQLAEVAVLVNAGRLEAFLLNDADAAVSLRLMNNIDLSGYASREGWTPIGTNARPFKSNFDGGGHVALGLVINRSAEDHQGLFGYIEAGTVKNLGVAGASISGRNNVGGVVGTVGSNGTLENSYSTGSIRGGSAVGGVAGSVISGTVRNCYSTGSVSGGSAVGGVAGTIDSAMLKSGVALNISISGSAVSDIGRVVGTNNTADLLGNMAFGGIPGTWSNPGADSADGDSKTAAELGTAGFFEALFANDSAWTYGNGKLPGLFGVAADMPVHLADKGDAEFLGDGTIGTPYQIRTAAELARLAALVTARTAPYANANKYYKLMNDLDLSGYATGAGWTPIGTDARPFRGYFDGDGHEIAGLVINRPGSDDQGLFGAIDSGGTVENLGLANVEIVGRRYVGGVTGNVYGTVQNCYVTEASEVSIQSVVWPGILTKPTMRRTELCRTAPFPPASAGQETI